MTAVASNGSANVPSNVPLLVLVTSIAGFGMHELISALWPLVQLATYLTETARRIFRTLN